MGQSLGGGGEGDGGSGDFEVSNHFIHYMLLHLLHLTLQLLQWSWICLVSSGEINFYICEILTKFDAF